MTEKIFNELLQGNKDTPIEQLIAQSWENIPKPEDEFQTVNKNKTNKVSFHFTAPLYHRHLPHTHFRTHTQRQTLIKLIQNPVFLL